ncbi:helix-turn-helix domain-containing protein [Pontimicrobium sp. SW4]|uniref:Helix-turn-helix domain-containing protein n=1 Tax=Pontimicrobium sp. SW4 TaxID=3153519 RepID=A0AAU7BS14_9FLAO
MNNLIVILTYGSLLLLSFLLIANPVKVNKKANFCFGIMLFLWSTFWFEEIFTLIGFDFQNDTFWMPIRFFQFLTPIVFYYSIAYYANPNFKFKKKDLMHLVFPIILLAFLVIKQAYRDNPNISKALNALVIIQAFYFIILSYIKIQKHKKRIRLFSSNTVQIDLKWLELIILAILILVAFIGVYNILFRGLDLNIFANIVSLSIIYFIAFNSLKQKEIFLLDENQRNLIITSDEQSKTKKRKVISDDELETLKFKLIDIMNTMRPYLDSELSLTQLAEITELTPHQLSYLINIGFDENFFWFVNRYRVQRVKELLSDKQNNYKTILGIAFESGFNSKTSFNTTFKKISGQTPSEFKKSSSSL